MNYKPTMTDDQVREMLAGEAERRGPSELARELGIAYATLRAIITGGRGVSASLRMTLAKLAPPATRRVTVGSSKSGYYVGHWDAELTLDARVSLPADTPDLDVLGAILARAVERAEREVEEFFAGRRV